MTLSQATQYWAAGKNPAAPLQVSPHPHGEKSAAPFPESGCLDPICWFYSEIIYNSTTYNLPHKAVTNPIFLLVVS